MSFTSFSKVLNTGVPCFSLLHTKTTIAAAKAKSAPKVQPKPKAINRQSIVILGLSFAIHGRDSFGTWFHTGIILVLAFIPKSTNIGARDADFSVDTLEGTLLP